MFTKKVMFTKNFTSSTYGNVWIGRKMTVKPQAAKVLVANGLAEILEEKQDNGTDNTDGSEKPSPRRPRRRR